MQPLLRKYVINLQKEDTAESIDAFVEQGMRVGVIDAQEELAVQHSLCRHLRQVFAQRNTPLGLMLRISPEAEPSLLHVDGYQYLLLVGYDPLKYQAQLAAWSEKADLIVEEPASLDIWTGRAAGIFTEDAALAEEARRRGFMVITSQSQIPADGLLFPQGTSQDELRAAAQAERPIWAKNGLGDIYFFQQHFNGLNCYRAIEAARERGAKAIVALTAWGEGLAALSHFYPPMPIIALAKRPEGEGMLLRQTLRWGTLPTAITKVPEDPDAVESFARDIARLYGYVSGDVVVATGHWMADKDHTPVYTITL